MMRDRPPHARLRGLRGSYDIFVNSIHKRRAFVEILVGIMLIAERPTS